MVDNSEVNRFLIDQFLIEIRLEKLNFLITDLIDPLQLPWKIKNLGEYWSLNYVLLKYKNENQTHDKDWKIGQKSINQAKINFFEFWLDWLKFILN